MLLCIRDMCQTIYRPCCIGSADTVTGVVVFVSDDAAPRRFEDRGGRLYRTAIRGEGRHRGLTPLGVA